MKAKADFFVVYIREAHPTDGWQVPQNRRQGVLVPTAKSEKDRNDAAHKCSLGLNLSLPMLIDGMDDAVERAYAGWPDRIYVIGKDGRIAYKGAPGPAGFKPEEGKRALLAELNRPQSR
jgi:hypothetical protein